MMDKETKEAIMCGVFMFCIILAFILIILSFKVRNNEDRIKRLEERLTEQTLEEPTTATTTEPTTEIILPKEPSDDEIVISVGWE